jgi:hypothetical protein
MGIRDADLVQLLHEKPAEVLCFSVEGEVVEVWDDWVSILT